MVLTSLFLICFGYGVDGEVLVYFFVVDLISQINLQCTRTETTFFTPDNLPNTTYVLTESGCIE
jgi:hypothetical protein